MTSDQHLEILKKEVARKAGTEPLTPHDFTVLAEILRDSGAGYLSESTLKRIWGYVESGISHHKSTLDILTRYIAGVTYSQWCAMIDEKNGSESGFHSDGSLRFDLLKENDEIEVRWLPDRVLHLRYIGALEFRILSSVSPRLKAGGRLRMSALVNGHAMVADVADADCEPFRVYIAGRTNGITWRRL